MIFVLMLRVPETNIVAVLMIFAYVLSPGCAHSSGLLIVLLLFFLVLVFGFHGVLVRCGLPRDGFVL